MLRLNFSLVVLFLLIIKISLYANSYIIEELDIYITINKNNTIDIEEELEINYKAYKHGIYRIIPFTRYPISDIEIYRDGKKEKFKIFKQKNRYKIRIGSKSKLITGIHKYTLKYRINFPIDLSVKSDTSRFLWEVIGKYNTYIYKWYIKIKTPKFYKLRLTSQNNKDYTQKLLKDLREKGDYIELSSFFNDPLYNTPIILEILYPREIFKDNLLLKLYVLFINSYIIYAIYFGLILLILWFIFGKDETPIKVVRYYPPPIPPAEAGILIDDTLDGRDIASIIFDWATKGYIKIIQKDKGIGKYSEDVWIEKIKDLPEEARIYERSLFQALFRYLGKDIKRKIVSLKDLSKDEYFLSMLSATRDILLDYTSENYYRGFTLKISDYLNRNIKPLMIFILFELSLTGYYLYKSFIKLGYIDYDKLQIFNIFLAITLATIFLLFFGKYIGKKSSKGLKYYGELLGYKDFLERVEKPVLERLIKEDPNYLNKNIAYLVALNVFDKWADKYGDILKFFNFTWYELRDSSDTIRGFGNISDLMIILPSFYIGSISFSSDSFDDFSDFIDGDTSFGTDGGGDVW